MKTKIVIALGGNALGNNSAEQKILVKNTAEKIVGLLNQNYTITLGHGNGPQIGMIFNAFAVAFQMDQAPQLLLSEANAMSQGYIGFHMLTALTNAITVKKLNTPVAYFLTQTVVDAQDPRFKNPTKTNWAFLPIKSRCHQGQP